MLASANTKGSEEKYVDSLDGPGQRLYASFKKNLDSKNLIWPKDTNALKDYRQFIKRYFDSPLVPVMRRNLAASLSDRFNGIVSPLLKGETSYSTRDACYYAAAELDSCLRLLGEQHYMYTNIKARKLFMDAMALTWALGETEYNVSLKPDVIKSIELLEESAKLEPNAAYTLSALGERYTFVYEFKKANEAFQKFLDLRPNDLYAKFCLGRIYSNLKQFDKAEVIFEKLVEDYPNMPDLKTYLSEAYFSNNKRAKSLELINQMIASDSIIERSEGYFLKGVYYSKTNNLDSAIHYYRITKSMYGECPTCDNNIGHAYFVNNHMDSARKYFQLLLDADTTNAFANFNLGTIELIENNLRDAFTHLIRTTIYAGAFTDGFVMHLQLYFGKKYPEAPKAEMDEFKSRNFIFNMRYVSYLSILYAYIRVPGMIENTENINFLFDQLFNYKQNDVLTWYHHACYLAMKKDVAGSIESLKKALELGFGNLFILKYDADLDSVRNTEAFRALITKYFPSGKN